MSFFTLLELILDYLYFLDFRDYIRRGRYRSYDPFGIEDPRQIWGPVDRGAVDKQATLVRNFRSAKMYRESLPKDRKLVASAPTRK